MPDICRYLKDIFAFKSAISRSSDGTQRCEGNSKIPPKDDNPRQINSSGVAWAQRQRLEGRRHAPRHTRPKDSEPRLTKEGQQSVAQAIYSQPSRIGAAIYSGTKSGKKPSDYFPESQPPPLYDHPAYKKSTVPSPSAQARRCRSDDGEIPMILGPPIEADLPPPLPPRPQHVLPRHKNVPVPSVKPRTGGLVKAEIPPMRSARPQPLLPYSMADPAPSFKPKTKASVKTETRPTLPPRPRPLLPNSMTHPAPSSRPRTSSSNTPPSPSLSGSSKSTAITSIFTSEGCPITGTSLNASLESFRDIYSAVELEHEISSFLFSMDKQYVWKISTTAFSAARDLIAMLQGGNGRRGSKKVIRGMSQSRYVNDHVMIAVTAAYLVKKETPVVEAIWQLIWGDQPQIPQEDATQGSLSLFYHIYQRAVYRGDLIPKHIPASHRRMLSSATQNAWRKYQHCRNRTFKGLVREFCEWSQSLSYDPDATSFCMFLEFVLEDSGARKAQFCLVQLIKSSGRLTNLWNASPSVLARLVATLTIVTEMNREVDVELDAACLFASTIINCSARCMGHAIEWTPILFHHVLERLTPKHQILCYWIFLRTISDEHIHRKLFQELKSNIGALPKNGLPANSTDSTLDWIWTVLCIMSFMRRNTRSTVSDQRCVFFPVLYDGTVICIPSDILTGICRLLQLEPFLIQQQSLWWDEHSRIERLLASHKDNRAL